MAPSPGIDPRGPRFAASLTAVLLLVVVALGLSVPFPSDLATRAATPGFLVFAVLVVIFGWSAIAGVRRHPFGWLFRALVRPRLSPPGELEDPAPPTFAQGIGFAITLVGAVLHLVGVPFALVAAASVAFVAAFLNAVFDWCLGCQVYLLLVRARVVRRGGASTA